MALRLAAPHLGQTRARAPAARLEREGCRPFLDQTHAAIERLAGPARHPARCFHGILRRCPRPVHSNEGPPESGDISARYNKLKAASLLAVLRRLLVNGARWFRQGTHMRKITRRDRAYLFD